jgi:hypothetical protein
MCTARQDIELSREKRMKHALALSTQPLPAIAAHRPRRRTAVHKRRVPGIPDRDNGIAARVPLYYDLDPCRHQHSQPITCRTTVPWMVPDAARSATVPTALYSFGEVVDWLEHVP